MWSQPVSQIPWGTLFNMIITKSSSKEEMLWHLNQTHNNNWSRRIVCKQFKLHTYERKQIEPQVTDIVKQDDHLKEFFKDTLALDFLGLQNIKVMNNPIGVSKYKILEDLPAYLIDKMKTIE